MSDTEARRLAEQIVREANAGEINKASPYSVVASAYIALLERTRLTDTEQRSVQGMKNYFMRNDLSETAYSLEKIISRLTTQPEAGGRAEKGDS